MAEDDEFRGAACQEHRQGVVGDVRIVRAIPIELDSAVRSVTGIDRHAKDRAEL